MANRRISELPLLAGADVAEQDLLTMVHVFEVDPTLKNKKITISGFRDYLSTKYVSVTGGTVSGNVLVEGNLTVTGVTVVNSFTSSGNATFSGALVQNNLTASGTISGQAITGSVVRGTSGVFGNLSGTTITGTTVSATTGLFAVATIGNLVYSGTSFTGITASFATGTFTNITGNTLHITAPSGATAAIICSGVVSGDANGFIIKGPLVILP